MASDRVVAITKRQDNTNAALAKLFSEMWSCFINGVGIDAYELEQALERTGLTENRECTEEEAASMDCDIEVGDMILCLTAEGKCVISAAKEPA